jgi:hypothetical protein
VWKKVSMGISDCSSRERQLIYASGPESEKRQVRGAVIVYSDAFAFEIEYRNSDRLIRGIGSRR